MTERSTNTSFVVSSLYDLLKPDGVNVIELGNGKYQLLRPSSLSNLHNIAFRSFTGDLLPFTSIELPKLHAELIMMTNGLKSATLTGQDTMDMPAVNTYDNTKQNIILSIDKAWTYDKDAESQVLYNIEEIVELMNEKLKDYFLYTATKPVWTDDDNISTMYLTGYKQFVPASPDNNFCSIMYNTTNNKLYIPRINSSGEFELKEIYNSSSTPPSPYTRIAKAFFDPLSNTGFIVYERAAVFDIKVDVIRWDSTNSRYTQEQVDTFEKPSNVDLRILDHNHPTYPLHFFANGTISSSRVIGYCYVVYQGANPSVPCLKFTYYINGTKYTPSPVSIIDYIQGNEHTADIYATNSLLYIYGLDIHTTGEFHLLCFKNVSMSLSDTVYAITISLPSFTLTTSGISFNTSGAAALGPDWTCTLGQYATQGVYQSIKYNFTNITKFTESITAANHLVTWILPNNCWIQQNLNAEEDGFTYVYYGTNIFHYSSAAVLYCKCFDPTNLNCYIGAVGSLNNDAIGTIYTGARTYIEINDLPASAASTFRGFGQRPCLGVMNNLAVTGNYPIYAYNEFTAAEEEYFNQAMQPNITYLAMVSDMNVTCSGVDQSNNSVALNPSNNGVLCSVVQDFIKLESLAVVDNAIVGTITIPQIQFASSYVLNFNLKIYSDPYYFNIYTSRDFTQDATYYNFVVKTTDIYYRASNVHVLDTLEYLILLKYNYNAVKLRCYGFPNADGIVFNLNESSYVDFKMMTADNTLNALIIELIGDDDEALPSTVLQQLFGKVSLAIDWIQ